MGEPITTSPEARAFVEAADRLVNLLATSVVDSIEGQALHRETLEQAYNAYDLARRALTGEDVSSA